MGQDHQDGGKTQSGRVQGGPEPVDTALGRAHEIRGIAHQAVHEGFEGGGQGHRVSQDALGDTDRDQILPDPFHGGFSMDGADQPHHREGASHPHPGGDDVLGVGGIGRIVQGDDQIGPYADEHTDEAEHQEVLGYHDLPVPEHVIAEQDQSDCGDHHLRIDVCEKRQVEGENEQARDDSRQDGQKELSHKRLAE